MTGISSKRMESPWIGIPQHVFLDWALDTKIPLPVWQRLQYLALGRCDESGIAIFSRGELARLVYGGPDKHRNLSHQIEMAVNYGVLHSASRRSFLRLPDEVLRSAPSAGYLKRVAR